MSGLTEWFSIAITRIRDLSFSFDDLKVLVPFFLVLLLVIWLLYRIKVRIKKAVQDEIYKSFPSIKNTIENFEKSLNLLKLEIERIEKKLLEFRNK